MAHVDELKVTQRAKFVRDGLPSEGVPVAVPAARHAHGGHALWRWWC